MNIIDKIIEDRKLNKVFDNSSIYKHGEIMEKLSLSLVHKQKLEQKDITILKMLHLIRLNLFEMFEAETEPKNQRKIVPLMEELEFRMQKAWKFEQDKNKHSWWFQVPHCTCPKKDNWKAWVVGTRVINRSCPVHGDISEN